MRFAAYRGTPYRWLNLRQLLPNNTAQYGLGDRCLADRQVAFQRFVHHRLVTRFSLLRTSTKFVQYGTVDIDRNMGLPLAGEQRTQLCFGTVVSALLFAYARGISRDEPIARAEA